MIIYPLRGWGSLSVYGIYCKFVYISHYFTLQWLSSFDLNVDGEGRWFKHSA